MPCMHPIPARWQDGGKPRLMAERDVREFCDEADDVLQFKSWLFLPCGTCVGCQLSRAREWAIRLALENQEHLVSSFVTLTFAERYVPPTLSRPEYAGFIRSLRKLLPPRSVRHFGCGEYGDTTWRPHYHAILFGTRDREVIERAWGKGFATVAPVNPARMAYVAGYCAKKVGWAKDLDGEERVDRETGEVYKYQSPFIQMSRRPGIGGAARRHWKSWRSSAIWSGQKVAAPRFLHRSWEEHASESEKAALELERIEKRGFLTVRELDAQELIAKRRVQLTMSRRSL